MIDPKLNELGISLKHSKAWNMELVNDGSNMRTEPVPPIREDKIDELFIDDSTTGSSSSTPLSSLLSPLFINISRISPSLIFTATKLN